MRYHKGRWYCQGVEHDTLHTALLAVWPRGRTMSSVFEGAGVKRYALRYRETPFTVWQYPPEHQYDTVEEARAALEAMPVSRGYQIVEKFPCVRYKPAAGQETARSKLLENVLESSGWKPFRLQWSNGRGWRDCPDLRFDTLKEAQEAACNGMEGMHRVMAATLEMRYEPVEVRT